MPADVTPTPAPEPPQADVAIKKAVERFHAIAPRVKHYATFTAEDARRVSQHIRDLTAQLEAERAEHTEDYELGKRDGYESAVQDFDLATGGDGEFKGSTIPGETVDVPAMKARVLDRLTRETERADAAVAEAKALREALEIARKWVKWASSHARPARR